MENHGQTGWWADVFYVLYCFSTGDLFYVFCLKEFPGAARTQHSAFASKSQANAVADAFQM
jgi:hypothetical protein